MHWSLIILIPLGLLALVAVPLALGRMIFPGFTLSLFRRFGGLIRRLLGKLSPELDLRLLVKAGNGYFRRAYRDTPYDNRLLFLPFCLRPQKCPADVDPEQGLLCTGGCPGCRVGQVRDEALALGYAAVYVVPSSRLVRNRGLRPSDNFIKDKIKEHGPGAALGVTCGWHLANRLLKKNTVRGGSFASVRGGAPATRTVVQGVLMDGMNCRRGTVDWDRVTELVRLSARPSASAADAGR